MSNDEWDDKYNQWIDELSDELYPEHREQAITEFTEGCFRRYYLAHPETSVAAERLLTEARALLPAHSSAALVFATAAIEVGLRDAILRPLLSGYVHTDSVADLLVKEVTDRLAHDKLKKLIEPLLKTFMNLDLSSFKRPESSELLWEEVRKAQLRRNRVVHDGVLASETDCVKAANVATYILETIFPSLVESLGLSFAK
jgi:hypothetical protein